MYGVERFVAVLNPPQAAILAVGAIEERAVVREGELAARPVLELTLSCDHRTVDGATASEFLRTVKQFLEEPGLRSKEGAVSIWYRVRDLEAARTFYCQKLGFERPTSTRKTAGRAYNATRNDRVGCAELDVADVKAEAERLASRACRSGRCSRSPDDPAPRRLRRTATASLSQPQGASARLVARTPGGKEFAQDTASTSRSSRSSRGAKGRRSDAEDDAFYMLDGELVFVVDGRSVAGPGTFVRRRVQHTFFNRGETRPASST